MNWSDERYVKVYARDTANWKMLPWEAKAVWLLLLRKLDGAGIVDTGSHDRNKVLALILDVPSDIVAKAIPALLADGTLVEVERGLLAPNFIDSQEARKTDTQSKRDQRQRIKDKRSATQRIEVIKAPVRLLSDDVRPCPPSAQLSSAQLEALSVDVRQPTSVDRLKGIWNDNRGKLSEWKLTNPAREKVALARLKELPLDQWVDVVKRVAASKFCNGVNDRGWRASPDWLLKPATAAAVLEGKYDDKGASSASQPTAVPHFG